MTETNMPDYETIRAAVAGEKWAVQKVLECYSGTPRLHKDSRTAA